MFKFCLNTSTISGYKLTLPQQIEIAADAGYDAIEPWMADIAAYERSGGNLEAIGQEIRDRGLTVQGAIGFFAWIVEDESLRHEALDVARRDMELVARLGGQLIAAPAMGATDTVGLDLRAAAGRYSDLCEVGREFGVRPLVEVWGFSKTLQRLGEAAFVAIESGHADAGILADVYHLYKGGSPVQGLGLLRGANLPLFHINDYPASLSPAVIADADRVWPGDGDAPLDAVAEILHAIGFEGYLSLELFNPAYWEGTALETARTGLQKARLAFA